jgi:hypothetical protein
MTEQNRLVLRNIETGEEHRIPTGGLRIGRTSQNDVVLGSEKVSRQHATLQLRGDEVTIQDEGSTNGTWVNEQRISAPTILQPNDRVRIGDAIFEIKPGIPSPVPLAARGPSLTWAGVPLVPIAIGAGVVFLILIGLLLGQARQAAILPTATASLEPTLAPTDTPTSVPTERPTVPPPLPQPPVATSLGMQFGAPLLVDPPNGAQYRGPNPMPYPMLVWASLGGLGADEYYRITIDYPHEGETWQEVGWTKQVQWEVPDYLPGLLSQPYECRWHVEVVRATATDGDGSPTAGVAISPPSETRMFVWARGSRDAPEQPTITPTPEFRP